MKRMFRTMGIIVTAFISFIVIYMILFYVQVCFVILCFRHFKG